MAYLRRLAAQNITGLPISGHSVVDEIVAGEYAIALQVFNDTAVFRRRQNAPVDWIAMNPALAVTSVISVAARALHPNAAKLFVDFDVGLEGQQIERENDYVPADPDIAPLDPAVRPDGVRFRAIYVTPEQVAVDLPKWGAIYNDLFR